ncbi:MAG TPA: hypothetical protein ENH29_06010 [Bacteroidetes bacterium]|nr:hypothetical protein [Bacteroidota bacterium]
MKKIFLIFLGAVALILAVAISYYMIAMSRLPADDGDLGQVEEIEVPPERPGTQSLILTGPIIRPLIFAIDMSKPNIKSLDWAELKSIDLTAEVKIKANVGPDGSLNFNPISDVRCPGHTKAGEMVGRVLQTWAFKPYKEGPITIRFNVGAIGKKLTIDISKLRRKEGVDPDTPIKVGRLYMIENGLKRNEVKIISW